MEALDYFRLIGSEFKDIPDEDVTDPDTGKVTQYGIKTWLDLYRDQVSKKYFGNLYDKALAYLTAHKLKMAGFGDTGLGKVEDGLRISSVSEGETSVSFSTSQSTNLEVDAEYALTTYGLEYLTLRRMCVIPIINAGEYGVEGAIPHG